MEISGHHILDRQNIKQASFLDYTGPCTNDKFIPQSKFTNNMSYIFSNFQAQIRGLNS